MWSTPQAENGITPSPDATRVAFVRAAAAPAAASAPATGRGGRGGAGSGGDLMIRSLADGKESVVVRGGDHPSAASAGRPTASRSCSPTTARTIRHEQTPHTPARKSSTPSPRTCRATRSSSRDGSAAPKALGSRRRLRRTPLARRLAFSRRSHLARFQAADDVGGRASPVASRGAPRRCLGQVLEHHRRCRARSRPLMASGSRS